MGLAVEAAVTLTTINCGCGGTYAISERYREQKQQEGSSWTCPYCAGLWGYANSGENARLKRELEAEKRELEAERKRKEWAQQDAKNSEKRRQAAVGQLTKLKNRVNAGVCPCCNRSFENLMRHMKTKHPDFAKPEK